MKKLKINIFNNFNIHDYFNTFNFLIIFNYFIYYNNFINYIKNIKYSNILNDDIINKNILNNENEDIINENILNNENKVNIKNKYTKKNNQEESILSNNEGNIFIGLSVLLVFSFVLVAIVLLNFTTFSNDINTDSTISNNFNYMIEDYNRNIPIQAKKILQNLSNEVIESHVPCYNAENMIKDRLQNSLDEGSEKYQKNNNILIESEVLSIYNGEDPYHINIKTLVTGKKGKMEYNNVVESVVSIEGEKDPLPFLMCKNHPTLVEKSRKISYNDALSYYLAENNLQNPEVYENASSSLFIKKCPYDPYEHHGDGLGMKNCLDNGYFHESADGSCYLCRLEGRGICPHYGLETFISPQKIANLTNITSISASDHVIFHDHYPGRAIEIYFEDGFYEILILDDSHGAKYGMI
jgi:hypothetical protein